MEYSPLAIKESHQIVEKGGGLLLTTIGGGIQKQTDVERIESIIFKRLPAELDDIKRHQLAREVNALAQVLIEAYHRRKSKL